ncbi:MAG TPA: Nif3-like dinuclear metal center hexameric protein [Bryobacteraceae bacterium]|nr:Nif3-like dinuclear metal center hexameric protein [Bryobacteraceae bacterium]
MNRRAFLAASAALTATAQTSPVTAAGIIERIKKNVGVAWREQTVDKVIAGNPDTPVRGIATTMMSTLDVLKRCAAAGRNLVITHEPTFYMHEDRIGSFADNPVFKYKTDFIREHDLVIFRFHDHWHMHQPDGIALGMMHDLGWDKNVVNAADPSDFTFPGTPLAQFANEIAARLNVRSMRIVGDPALPVHYVATSWGYLSRDPGITLLSRPEVNVLICGEAREWEGVEFAQDAIAAGQKKALIVMNHVRSEQSGMKECASWLKGFVSEVPVEFIAADEPFWTPSLRRDRAAS